MQVRAAQKRSQIPTDRQSPSSSRTTSIQGMRRQPYRADSKIGRKPAFWDNLTRIPLVKAALRQLDRRNEHAARRPAAQLSTSSCDGDLVRYARHGGPDLSDIRGLALRSSSADGRTSRRGGADGARESDDGHGRQSCSDSQCTTTDQTRSSSPFDAAFRQHLIDWRVWPIGHFLENGQKPAPPDNLEDIVKIINAPRLSLEAESFGVEDFKQFEKVYNLARGENGRSRTLDFIEGTALAPSSSDVKQGPVEFKNLLILLPENLVPGTPDRAYGARPETLDTRVREELESLILPTTARDIVCPNFIVHIECPAGDPETAKVQAVYDGALAARGMEALRAYGDDTDADEGARSGHGEDQIARTITCTFADGVLRMYAVHRTSRGRAGRIQALLQLTPSWAAEAEYTTSLVGSWLMHDSLEDFRRGAAAFRNGLDWARRQRDEAISRANSKVQESDHQRDRR